MDGNPSLCHRSTGCLRALVLLTVGLAAVVAGCEQPVAVGIPQPPTCLTPPPPPEPPAPPPPAPSPPPPRIPRVRTVTLGRSVKGTPILMHVFGSTGPTTLIFGGIHGDEPASRFVAAELATCLRANPSLYAARRVAVIPAANPDGLAARTRCNARGVDCNRNFPAGNWKASARSSRYHGGPSPGSEPETRAILEAVRTLRPARVVAVHAISRGRQCNNYDGPARAMAELMARHNGYPPKASIGYPTPGSFGTWAGVDRQIPTVTLELPSRLPGAQAWLTNRPALLAFIQADGAAIGR